MRLHGRIRPLGASQDVRRHTHAYSDEVVRCLWKYAGAGHGGLYMLVVRFLTESHALLARQEVDVRRLLEAGERLGALSPLGVGLVGEWLVERIGRARREIKRAWFTSFLFHVHI